jgi:hypothetical protein
VPTSAPAAEEGRTYQYLSFYQREMALFVWHALDRPVERFSLDTELPALFKVGRGWGIEGGRTGRGMCGVGGGAPLLLEHHCSCPPCPRWGGGVWGWGLKVEDPLHM